MAIEAPASCTALLVRISGGSPGTQTTLEKDGLWVTACFDVSEAERRIQTLRPDLLIVELDGQRPGDWDACQQLARIASQPVLALARDPSPQTRLAAFASGADDVLAQPFEPAELVARTRALMRRGAPRQTSATVLHHRDLELDLDAHLATLGDQPLSLTLLEFRLLRTLLEQPQRTFRREELLAQVHTFDERLPSDRSIDLHVTELRTKLGDSADAPRYIETVRGIGYRLPRASAPARSSTGSSAHLTGKVGLVIGGRGIGECVARTLASAGASVVVFASGPEVEPLADGLVRQGLDARGVAADSGDAVQLRASIAEVQPDILVWAAEAAVDVSLSELDDHTWDQMLRRSLGGALVAVSQVLPRMLQRGSGRIVIVAPRGASAAGATIADGLVGLAGALAAETAHTGVTVNAVCPRRGGAGCEVVGQAVLLLIGDNSTLSGQVLHVEV